ncbi:hypothetical protein Moror_6290 [Moniliophthora roreri MCA 2997]|uniref:Transcriptional coactivator p15 (PC4) C-terminal domain-containing protein n=2 Tax=Moniliophthora roreri TaxID=221103 RepID=V2YZC9_MONRO|nr:hypothetical protein Moror_6290 [Moniliophthora roreri MCA 2997]KAI3618918.1 hypothetical protein WG66_000625 [Moniliophthora roreri]
MAKRKTAASSDNEDPSDASVQPSPPPSKKTAKKPKVSNVQGDSDGDSEEEKPIKKPKSKAKSTKTTNSDRGDVAIHINSEGDSYVDLGKKKRATVRSFKGKPLVDIREFYGDEGQEKPGKKGISLTDEQWEMLKKSMPIIDRLFREQTK